MIKYGRRQNEVNNIAWAMEENQDDEHGISASVSYPRSMGWDIVIEALKETVSEHFNEQIDEAFKDVLEN